MDLVANGLDPDAPFIATGSFGGYGEMPVPPWLADEVAKAVLRILEQARDRALELAKANADAIRGLAAIVYRERRLTDERVTAALRSVGLHPAEIRP